jgi:glutamate synthase (NADPH) small chain
MGDPKGFLNTARETPRRRPVDVRLSDWREVYEPFAAERTERQAARCMDCGIPFCHNGCPLGNLIPEWNDLVYRSDWAQAAERLHATNNFPEFTGRLCPAPCEAACVLGINAEPVTIKQVEVEIIDRAWAAGDVIPVLPTSQTGFSVAVVGSGPAGLAAAQQLTRAGHQVTVFERDDRPGGLLRYGIPEFKMEKRHLDRRLEQMAAEGTRFECGVSVTSVAQLDGYSAVVLAGGARVARDLAVPGRDLAGIYQAMEYLPPANRRGPDSPISAEGKHVVIIGGGDTGADCLGTSLRQGALSVTQLEIMPKPPKSRAANQPWPTYPMIYRVASAHEEGGERVYADRGGLRGRQVRAGARVAPGDPLRPRAAGDGLHGRGASRSPRGPGRLIRHARQRRPHRVLRDIGPRRVRGGGHGPRPVADRLGDRGGPQRRGLRRPVPARA